MEKHSLKGEKRTVFGRKIKKLRKDGIIPANIFGKKLDSLAIQVDEKEFEKIFTEAGETGVVSLSVAGKDHPVLISNLQRDPLTSKIFHIDFRQINLNEKVAAQVPVEMLGESPAVKQGLGTVVQYVNEIEIEALPADLPENFLVDISVLEAIDQAVKISDIVKNNSKIEIKDDPETIVVKLEPQQEEEPEPEPVAEETAEGESATPEDEEQSENPEEQKF